MEEEKELDELGESSNELDKPIKSNKSDCLFVSII